MWRSGRLESWSMSISRQASTICVFRRAIGFMRWQAIGKDSIPFP